LGGEDFAQSGLDAASFFSRRKLWPPPMGRTEKIGLRRNCAVRPEAGVRFGIGGEENKKPFRKVERFYILAVVQLWQGFEGSNIDVKAWGFELN
jgi:hypothetical protein